MSTDSKAQLLPCPFCGAKAHFEIDDDRWEWVECESCGMQGNRSASLMEDCKPKLAEAWNSRAYPAQVPEGWKMIFVNDAFADLMFWLDRCADKGHLENCQDLIEPYERFEYRYPPKTPEQSK